MNDGSLDNALKAGRRLGIAGGDRFQTLQFVIDEAGEVLPQLRHVNATGFKYGSRVLIFG